MKAEDFLTVHNEMRDVPFWALNGKLEEGELKRQISVMKEMGMGGAFIHSRCGLQTEYLSKEWFAYVKVCAKELAENGMEAYLYDEDRWPSGSAGGYATMNPKFRQKSLSYRLIDRESFDLEDEGLNYIASFGARFDDGGRLIAYYPAENKWQIKDGDSAIIIEKLVRHNSGFFNGYTYLDTLNSEATRHFIDITLERYKTEMGELFGKEIKGVFTDEPFRGTLFYSINGGVGDEWEKYCPFTEKLFEAYEEQWGESLEEKLPELFFPLAAEDYSVTLYRYIETIEELFLNNFLKPYHDWCAQNNLILTGHLLHEDSLSAQTGAIGSIMRAYEYFDLPGMDMLREGRKNYWVAKQLSSVGNQLGKKRLLSELYGCTGWQMTMQRYKQVGDWQALCGVNLRCPHLLWYTMQGEGKRDYPASIFYQSAYYREFSYFEDYYARLNYFLANSTAIHPLLVLNPVESVWGIHTAHSMEEKDWRVKSPIYKEREENYRSFCNLLMEHNVPFDYGEEYLMRKHGVVRGRSLQVGKAEYAAVAIYDCLTLKSSTVALLNEFCNAGGIVYLIGSAPERMDGVRHDYSCETFMKNAVRFASPDREFLAAASCLGGVGIRIEENGAPCRKVLSTVRRCDDGEGYGVFFVNADWERSADCTITLTGCFSVNVVNLRTGENRAIPARICGENTVLTFRFDCGQELFLLLHKDDGVQVAPHEGTVLWNVSVPERVRYALSEPNVLVLDAPDCELNGECLGVDEILRLGSAIDEKLGLPVKDGKMVQPWMREKKGCYEKSPRANVTLHYVFNVEAAPEKLSLAMEQADCFRISLNGKVQTVRTGEHYIDNSFEFVCLNTSDLNPGRNILTLEILYREGINLEPVYLTGCFGVYNRGEKKDGYEVYSIGNLPETLAFGDIVSQGLPFYGGKIYYCLALERGEYKVVFYDNSWADIRVWSESKCETVAFRPFECYFSSGAVRYESFYAESIETQSVQMREETGVVFEVTLTRANTFGPYHAEGIDNDSDVYYCSKLYKTTGADFRKEMFHRPNGLEKFRLYRIEKEERNET